jgi:hypothetical protein
MCFFIPFALFLVSVFFNGFRYGPGLNFWQVFWIVAMFFFGFLSLLGITFEAGLLIGGY